MTAGPGPRDPSLRAAGDETQTFDFADTRLPGPTLQRGKLLGRYVILRALGTGGMGSVYAAFDPELDRRVALKVLRNDHRRAGGTAAQARLLREAQAIAKLAHPNVVAVHDAGTVDGQSYIAMEIIEGSTLAAWLNMQRRTWREVVGVFLQAGRGLAAAHQKGLIHRDFKPSNVMVGFDQRVRVLDFGLAREAASPLPRVSVEGPVEPRPGSGESPTKSGATHSAALGTPAYVAPELLRGSPSDARSDQYSFSLAFCRALTGEPFDETASVDRLEKSRIPKWLVRIVDRGLSSDPAQRFPSMEALLAALERGSGQRNRRLLATAVGTAIVLSSVGFWRSSEPASSMVCQGAERRLAGIWDEPRKAAGLSAFSALGKPFAVAGWRRAAAALDAYADSWTRLHVEACEATRLRGEQSEEMLDLQMACLDRRLQELDAAADLLLEADAEIALNAAKLAAYPGDLGICSDREALLADYPPPPDPQTAARVSEIRALIDQAGALDNVGKYQDARSVAETAVEKASELSYPPVRGEALFRLSQEAARTGQRAQMVESLLQISQIALAADHDELLARALTHLILAHWLRGEGAEARKWNDLAEAAIERLSRPLELTSHRLFFLGMVANTQGRPEEAISLFERSLAVSPNADAFDQLAALNNLGVAYRLLGQFDQARASHLQSLEVTRQAYGQDHPAMATVYVDLGDLDSQLGDFEAALTFYRRALAIQDAATDHDDPHHAFALTGIGRALIELGQPAAALEPLEEAVRLREAQTLDPGNLSLSRFQLARALWDSGAEKSRARDLVIAAREVQQTLGERAAEDLAASRRWLAEHR